MTQAPFDVADYVLALDRAIDERLGGWSSFSGVVEVFPSGRPSGQAGWDGTVRLRQDVVDAIASLHRGEVDDPDATMAALEVVVHELAHLRSAPVPSARSPRDAFVERPSTRALDEAVTQLWARRYTPELIVRAGLDRRDARIRHGVARSYVHHDLVPGIEALLAGVAKRSRMPGDELLDRCCQANAAQKWQLLTGVVFERGGLPEIVPAVRHDTVRAALEQRMRLQFDVDLTQPTVGGTAARSGMAGAQALGQIEWNHLTRAEEARLENRAGADLMVAADTQRAYGHHLLAEADAAPDAERRSSLVAEVRGTLGRRQLAAANALGSLAEYRMEAYDLEAGDIVAHAQELAEDCRRQAREESLDDESTEVRLRQAESFAVIRAEAELERTTMDEFCRRQLAEAAVLLDVGERNLRNARPLEVPGQRLRALGVELLSTAHQYESVPGVLADARVVAQAREHAAATLPPRDPAVAAVRVWFDGLAPPRLVAPPAAAGLTQPGGRSGPARSGGRSL